jgi:hypothetical protein
MYQAFNEASLKAALAVPGYLQQLFALQVTCLKTWLQALNGLQAEQQNAECTKSIATAATLVAGSVAGTCQAVLDHRSSGASSSSSSSSSNSSSSTGGVGISHSAPLPAAAAAAPWVALLARSFFVLTAALEAAAAAACSTAADSSDTATVQDSSTRAKAIRQVFYMDMGTEFKALARRLGAAGLPAEVLQQLQQQAAAAKEQLSLQAGLAAGAAPDSSSAEQQLRAFAQAVMGRIPLSSACNNPSCVSLAQRSELLLVGGKSCMCARCKAARYAAGEGSAACCAAASFTLATMHTA